MVARQLGIDDKVWVQYAEREETRREHLSELRAFLGLTPFGLRQFHQFARWLAELAMQTGKGVVLATALVEELRREKVVCLRSMRSNEFARWRSRARIAGST